MTPAPVRYLTSRFSALLARRGEMEIVNAMAALGSGATLAMPGNTFVYAPSFRPLLEFMSEAAWMALFFAWAGAIVMAWACRQWDCRRVAMMAGVLLWGYLAWKTALASNFISLAAPTYGALAMGSSLAYWRLKAQGHARTG